MDRTFTIRLKGRWVRVAVIVAITALVAFPVGVIASDRFDDVPDSNTFHDDINAIADVGVTRGCNPPANTEYCPDDFVTREQMAAFMNRLGNLDGQSTPSVDAATLEGFDSSDFAKAGEGGGGDADTVDGFNANEIVRAGSFEDTGPNITSTSFVSLGEVTMQAGRDCILHMSGSVSWDDSPDPATAMTLEVQWFVDNAAVPQPYQDATRTGSTDRTIASATAADAVEAGTHSVELMARVTGAGQNADIETVGGNVLCVAFNASGNTLGAVDLADSPSPTPEWD